MKKKSNGLLVVAAASAIIGGLALPANAAPAAVTVSPAGPLARSASSVSVTVGNVPAGQGIYLMYCATPAAGTRPTSCFGRGVWASSDSKMTAQGAVALDGALALPIAIQFTPQGGAAVDCEKVGCGVFVRRDHMGPTDYSLDSFTALSFVPVIQPKVEVSVESGRVLFSAQGLKGKTLEVNFGARKLSRAVSSDSLKFYVGNAKAKSIDVSVSSDQSQLFAEKLKLKN